MEDPLPDVLVLRPSKAKWIFFLAVGALAAVAVNVPLWPEDDAVGILIAVDLIAVVWIAACGAMLLPNAHCLRLEKDSFSIGGLGGHSENFTWRTVSPAEVVSIVTKGGRITRVGFNLSDPPNASALRRFWNRLNRNIGAQRLVPDTYGMEPEDLARMMNRWRTQAIDEADR